MKVDIETPHDWARKLTITVPADRVRQERQKVASRYAKRIRLPGFRKGKIPAAVVEKQFGPSIDSEAVEQVINAAYQEALRDQGIDPISQAAVDNVDYEPGKDLTFEVQFEVRPEITLDRLGGFTVSAPVTAIQDEDVQRVVDRLRQQSATWNPLEGGAPGEGDRATVEITPLEEPSEGEEAPEPREYKIVLGAGEVLEDIDAAIRTLQPGEEGEFAVELPGGDADGDHRVRLKLLSAEHPELPEADDAFAKDVGGFESIDELQARVREDLEAEAEREGEREIRGQLMRQVLEANAFEAPPSLVDQYLDSLMQAPEGADPEQLAEAKEQARPIAEHAVRRMLVIDRIAEMEGLKATQSDIEARIEEIAGRNDMEPAEVRRQLARSGRLDTLASDLAEQRVYDYLKSLSTIETKDG